MTSAPRRSGPPVELRVVTPDDWETWRDIRLEALARAPYAFGSRLADWEAAPEERWRGRLELAGSHNLVAVAGGTPVGMATGVAGDEPGEASLISMYVSASARGLGVGGALVDAVERWAARGGHTRLCLHVVATNTPARRLYERHGLVVVGEVERESQDDPLELRMCKPLNRVAGR